MKTLFLNWLFFFFLLITFNRAKTQTLKKGWTTWEHTFVHTIYKQNISFQWKWTVKIYTVAGNHGLNSNICYMKVYTHSHRFNFSFFFFCPIRFKTRCCHVNRIRPAPSQSVALANVTLIIQSNRTRVRFLPCNVHISTSQFHVIDFSICRFFYLRVPL